MTTTILLCTDASRNALAAVSLGGLLAEALGADTTLLAAGRNPSKVQEALAKADMTLGTFDISPTTLVRTGRPVDQFVHQIQQGFYDLAVVGYRKRNLLEKAFNGCMAARVVHHATTSVLVVRDGRPAIRRLLIGIGGNGYTAQMAEWGARIASAIGARVTVLHVESAPPLMYAGLEEVHQTLTEFLATDTPAAHALRLAAAILDQAGVPADLRLTHGVADRELLRVAQEGDYDLLIIGSAWAQPPISRLVLSNVTLDILLNTRRPVLVVHP